MLKLILLITGYRFHDSVYPKLRLPYQSPGLNAKEIRDKARASAAVVGIFVALLVALLAMLIGTDDVIKELEPFSTGLVQLGILGALLPYLVLREERKISAATAEARVWRHRLSKTAAEGETRKRQLRKRHGAALCILLIFYIAFFLSWPWSIPASRALTLSGLFLVVGALIFLVWSIELYDTAGGLQRLDVTEYHFHLASLASNCYLFGLPLTLVGSALLLCIKHPRTGYWLSVLLLVLLILMTHIERKIADTPILTQNDIRIRAYALYEERRSKGLPGTAFSDWLNAERELLR